MLRLVDQNISWSKLRFLSPFKSDFAFCHVSKGWLSLEEVGDEPCISLYHTQEADQFTSVLWSCDIV